jgi:hypothetical protein
MSDIVGKLRARKNIVLGADTDCAAAADEIKRLCAENERLRKALATYACRCGDGECYVDEFVASCGRSAREALGLILNANSLPYAQEIASKALEEEK